jgi:hypothetical protein
MVRSRIAGSLILLLVAGVIGGIVASFLTANDLLTGSEWRLAAAASFGVVVLTLLVFASVGRPWRRWQRTPYW